MVIGIVCEFDPLHRGHARLLSHARALGADTVVCAMSGSFTQLRRPVQNGARRDGGPLRR